MALGNIVDMNSSDIDQGFPISNGEEEKAVSATEIPGSGLEGVASKNKGRVESHKGKARILGILEVPACLICEKLGCMVELHARCLIVGISQVSGLID